MNGFVLRVYPLVRSAFLGLMPGHIGIQWYILYFRLDVACCDIYLAFYPASAQEMLHRTAVQSTRHTSPTNYFGACPRWYSGTLNCFKDLVPGVKILLTTWIEHLILVAKM